MLIMYLLFAAFVLFIFNSLTDRFCKKMEMEILKQRKVFRTINIMILILLVCSYLRVLNVMA
ncbi:hypothetical protein BN988_01219 [Oceanobacillus picturae]|uniref:Uncharacterized protein n=1 Tax=Oceanobacillus picturae TaxID=171693 RepID=W9AAI1_9BACI|nr:hypothetical protein [Oceanobacillus picturae]RIU90654.1 hypothetical protein D1864_12820 [Oceanobacillus picturae]CDO02744.1 hypothetical protein BN988_01219 [Oceanobacillus picturae]